MLSHYLKYHFVKEKHLNPFHYNENNQPLLILIHMNVRKRSKS